MIGRIQRSGIAPLLTVLAMSACSNGPDSAASTATSNPTSTPTAAADPATSSQETASDGTSSEGADDESSACTAPDGESQLLDQDFSDHQVPWERNGADRVAIYFEAGSVSDEYRGYLDQGAAAWNRSPCLDVIIVDACPAGANCVTVSLTGGDDADGNFDSREANNFTVGGHIDLYVDELDKLGDGAKLNVTIHEMGHAVGLRHRQTGRVLMNGDTYTDIFDPDDTDLHNLRVLYGAQA